MLSIAVVDDDCRSREEIAATARNHMQARGEDCRVTAFADAGSFLAEASRQRFDIALLDIIMPEKSGLEAALELYERDHDCRIVFLTVSPDYAIHGYRVNALDYLLKPLDTGALGRALDRCRERSINTSADASVFTLILREGSDMKKVAASDILYCQSDGKKVFFYGLDFTISCRGKLDEFKARLPQHFVQTHRRYLVNLAHAVNMSPGAMRLDNGAEIPIGRMFKKSASATYLNHVLGESRRA